VFFVKKRVLSLTASLILAGVGILLTMWLLPPTPIHAADYTVGGVCGSTIQACIDFAAPGDTVIVPAGTWNESVTLGQPINLTGVNSATAIIQAVSGQRVLTVTGAAIDSSVVISGLTFSGGDVSGGNTCYSGGTTNCGGGILVTDNAQPTIQHVIIENNNAYRGGGLYANETGALHLDHVIFRNNTVLLTGGGLHAPNTPVTVTNSVFQQNTTTDNVGGALVTGADYGVVAPVFISNTTFLSNTAQCNGGIFSICEAPAVYLFDQDVQIISSHFEGNSCAAANCDGGGVFMSTSFNDPSLSLVNSDFINNTAGGRGGGASVGNVMQMTVVNGRFENNRALSDKGGGLDHSNFLIAANAAVSGTQFISNSAALDGGGLYSASDIAISSATFERNSSGGDGGGLLIDFGGTGSSLNNTRFISNTSQSEGGGAFVFGSDLAVSGGSFSGNSALADAGGLHACGNVTLLNTTLISNTAQESGGGVFVGPREGSGGCGSGQNVVVVTNGRFEVNTSQITPTFFSEGGGGLYVAQSDSSLTITDTDFINNRAAALGGGVHVLGTAVLSGGTFQNNTATVSSGGGIRAGGSMTADGTQFTGNVSGFAGGGAQAGGSADVGNALFQGNQAYAGGGLAVDDVVTIDNVRFLSNTAITGTGGGLNSSAALTVSNSLFQGNSSASNGGGLHGFTGRFVLSNTQFLTNSAANGGGLNYAFNPLSAVDVTVRGNTAISNGGGLATSGSATFSGNWEFSNNTAGGDGGGAYAFDGEAVGNALLEGNTAVGAGGGLFLRRFAHITNSLFLSNAADLGGGLAISRTASGTQVQFVINSLFSHNTAATGGTAFYYNQPRPINLIHNTFAQAGQAAGTAITIVTGTVNITNTIIASHTTGIDNVGGSVTEDYDLFFGNTTNMQGAVSGGANSLVGDPAFVNPASGDYHLTIGSAALDKGVDAGVTLDIDSQRRPAGQGYDLGVDEYWYGIYLPMTLRNQ
jgi:predicted outer membrane repeat protein